MQVVRCTSYGIITAFYGARAINERYQINANTRDMNHVMIIDTIMGLGL